MALFPQLGPQYYDEKDKGILEKMESFYSESITINQLANLSIKLMGKSNIKPIYEEPRLGDIRDSLANIARAGTFGYFPKYSLEEGLRETITRFKNET